MSEKLQMIDKETLHGKMVVAVETRGYPATGLGARFITILPYREFAHVSRVFHFDDGSRAEHESIQGRGVCWHEPRTGRAYESFRKKLTRAEMQALLEFSLRIEGDYDWKGCFGFLRKTVKHNPFKWFCSELLAYEDYMTRHPISRRKPFQETPTSYMMSNDVGKRSPQDEDVNNV